MLLLPDEENDDDDSMGGHAYQGLGDSSKAEGSAGQGEIQCRGQNKAMHGTVDRMQFREENKTTQGTVQGNIAGLYWSVQCA